MPEMLQPFFSSAFLIFFNPEGKGKNEIKTSFTESSRAMVIGFVFCLFSRGDKK